MIKDPLLVVQIISIIGYVGTVFFLYRILVKQKDATIDLLKNRISMLEQQLSTGRDHDQQKISLLEQQLTILKEQNPDVLVKKYKERLDLAIEELNRVETDMKDTVEDMRRVWDKGMQEGQEMMERLIYKSMQEDNKTAQNAHNNQQNPPIIRQERLGAVTADAGPDALNEPQKAP